MRWQPIPYNKTTLVRGKTILRVDTKKREKSASGKKGGGGG